MKHIRILSIVSLVFMAVVPTASAVDEGIESLSVDHYIGRDLLENGRAAEAGVQRMLPESCPPFFLRDETNKIIDPQEEPDVNRPISTKATCGACHDYQTITSGYHFQMGRDELFRNEEENGLDKGPGFFGKFQLLYQRQLAPVHFDSEEAIDMTPSDWVTSCGVCHPGGGPAEFDRFGRRYDRVMEMDENVNLLKNSDYYGQHWDETGVIEADCFMCHYEKYHFSTRAQEIKKKNFKWASTMAAGLAVNVGGDVRDDKIPQMKYMTNMFQADGKVNLHIQRPTDRACITCHDISGVQKRGTTWHSDYVQDVHTSQGLTCIQCHSGDIRHNFAKGNSTSLSARNDVDGSMMGCQECHSNREKGAPDYTHIGIPPLHFKRMACQACHITERPFYHAQVIETLSGKAIELAVNPNAANMPQRKYNALWQRIDMENLLGEPVAFTEEELDGALNLSISEASEIRSYFDEGVLPEGAFTVRSFIEAGNPPYRVNLDDEKQLLLLALQETVELGDTELAITTFRGTTYRLYGGLLRELDATISPRRVGFIESYPVAYGYAEEDGLIYPETAQLGVFWAAEIDGVIRPLFLRELGAAWEFVDKHKINVIGGEGDETELKIFDDNNDRWPEVNTKDEMKVMAWAISRTIKRDIVTGNEPILDPETGEAYTDEETGEPITLPVTTLYYIKGESTYKVTCKYDLYRPQEEPATGAYIILQQLFEPGELWLEYMYEATVENESSAELQALAKRLRWSISHGIEPSTQALGLGIKGCRDCHSLDSPIYAAEIMVDPFDENGKPVTKPAYEIMGLTKEQIKYGHIRESYIKGVVDLVLILVIALCALHFLFIGPRINWKLSEGPSGILRFAYFHEIAAYWAAAFSVTVLGLTCVLFRLTGQNWLGAFIRDTHHKAGIVGSICFGVFFVCLLPYMIPFVRSKFSALEKFLFWGANACLVAIIFTGLQIHWNYDVAHPDQQLWYLVHDTAALFFVCFVFVHMYNLVLVHPQAIGRVFGGNVSRAWASMNRKNWKAAQKKA